MSIRAFCAVTVMSISLAGCNGFSFRPTMASDAPLTGYEGRVLQLEMMRPFEVISNNSISQEPLEKMCALISPTFQEKGSERFLRGRRDTQTLTADRPSFCLIYKTNPKPSEVRSYIVSGMAYTDYLCDVFFARIAERSAKREFGRSTANDVGTAVSAILGLANAGSQVTGGIGAGFGLLDSGISNYDEAFKVDADLPALQKLVQSEQAKIRNEVLGSENASNENNRIPETYQGAAIEIMRYANTCSFTGMRGLLTESMLEKSAENYRERPNLLDFSILTSTQRTEVLKALGIDSTDELSAVEEEAANEGSEEAADGDGE